MKPGDMVRTPNLARTPTPRGGYDVEWWWCGKIGIIVREAIPDSTGPGEWAQCWHVMIDNRTANLREEHLELISETR